MFQIFYSRKAEKFLRKQDKATQERLVGAVAILPMSGDIKRLRGMDG